MSKPTSVILGWDAPPIGKQFPQLSPMVGSAIQRDHDDLFRLKMRGLIPPAEHKKAIERMVKRLSKEIKLAEDPS